MLPHLKIPVGLYSKPCYISLLSSGTEEPREDRFRSGEAQCVPTPGISRSGLDRPERSAGAVTRCTSSRLPCRAPGGSAFCSASHSCPNQRPPSSPVPVSPSRLPGIGVIQGAWKTRRRPFTWPRAGQQHCLFIYFESRPRATSAPILSAGLLDPRNRPPFCTWDLSRLRLSSLRRSGAVFLTLRTGA